LVMLDQATLVFVEVRYRTRSSYGSALDSIDHKKQRKIRRTSAFYLQSQPQHNHRLCRFDAVAIHGHSSRTGNDLQWIRNAF